MFLEDNFIHSFIVENIHMPFIYQICYIVLVWHILQKDMVWILITNQDFVVNCSLLCELVLVNNMSKGIATPVNSLIRLVLALLYFHERLRFQMALRILHLIRHSQNILKR